MIRVIVVHPHHSTHSHTTNGTLRPLNGTKARRMPSDVISAQIVEYKRIMGGVKSTLHLYHKPCCPMHGQHQQLRGWKG